MHFLMGSCLYMYFIVYSILSICTFHSFVQHVYAVLSTLLYKMYCITLLVKVSLDSDIQFEIRSATHRMLPQESHITRNPILLSHPMQLPLGQ